MADSPTYTVKYRRRRENLTNYRKRLKLVASKLPRLVIRKTNKYIIAQIVAFDPKGDNVIVSAHSKELEKFNWPLSKKNLPAAYLLGLIIGKRAKDKVKEVILDLGPIKATKASRMFAVAKGAIDAGLAVRVSEEVLPDETRIRGEHISSYYATNPEKFSQYSSKGIKAEEIPTIFEKVKEKILSA